MAVPYPEMNEPGEGPPSTAVANLSEPGEAREAREQILRFSCLELAVRYGAGPEIALGFAEKWLAFVKGEPKPEGSQP